MRRSARVLPFVLIIAVSIVALVAVLSAKGQPLVRVEASHSAWELRQLADTGRSVRIYRARTWSCQDSLGSTRTRAAQKWYDLPLSQPYRNWVRDLWSGRDADCLRTVAKRTLPATNDWETATGIVQRAFPGTRDWLLSCSGAEGGHGSFVLYGGRAYYPGAEYAHTFWGWMVGGWMQYMWPTFRGHYRNGLDSLRERGYITRALPRPENVEAWRSPLAQAIAAGWARWSGNDNSHWAASWGNGC